METDGFVTFWFEAAQKGDEAAATHLWDWFYPKLVKLAQAQLDKSKRRVYDEEDVALSAFHGVYRDARGGRVPKNCNRNDIWGLLTTQLLRKIIDRRRADAAQKRGGDEVRGDSAFLEGGIDLIASREPGPEFALELLDEANAVLARLSEPLRQVALLKMDGLTNEEIAAEIGLTCRSVERKVERIRKQFTKDG